jgi:hypothetical protein
MFLGPAMEAPFIPRIENMTTSPNNPVFPEQWLTKPQFNDVIPTLCSKGGLTIRELFAALAMQAILAGCYTNPDAEEIPSEWLSDQALEHADALIDALNKEGQADG